MQIPSINKREKRKEERGNHGYFKKQEIKKVKSKRVGR
jgi:hypothetical protein